MRESLIKLDKECFVLEGVNKEPGETNMEWIEELQWKFYK